MVIRTKHFLVSVLALLCAVVVGGGWRVFHDADTQRMPTAAVILSAPKDSYEVVQDTKNTIRENRDAFIQKVRDDIAAEPPRVETTPPVVIEDVPPQVAPEESVETIIQAPDTGETVIPAPSDSVVDTEPVVPEAVLIPTEDTPTL